MIYPKPYSVYLTGYRALKGSGSRVCDLGLKVQDARACRHQDRFVVRKGVPAASNMQMVFLSR